MSQSRITNCEPCVVSRSVYATFEECINSFLTDKLDIDGAGVSWPACRRVAVIRVFVIAHGNRQSYRCRNENKKA